MKKIAIEPRCEPYMYNTYVDLNVFEIGDVVEVRFGKKSPLYAGKTKKFVVNNLLKHHWRRPTKRLALVPVDGRKDDVLILDDADRFECLMIDLFEVNRIPYKGWENKRVTKIKKI